jgi:hypothetical protein
MPLNWLVYGDCKRDGLGTWGSRAILVPRNTFFPKISKMTSCPLSQKQEVATLVGLEMESFRKPAEFTLQVRTF